MTFLKYIGGIGFTICSLLTIAQVDTIKTGDIEIIKEYTPFVEDGKKQSFQPVMPSLELTERGNLQYNIPSEFIETQYQPDELQPLPYQDKGSRYVRTGYIKAGYGTANNPLAQFAINALENDNYTIGVRGGYQAVKGDLIDQQMHDAQLEVFGTKEISNATVSASIGYDRNANWLFGFDQANPDIHLINFRSDKIFNIVSADVGLESANTDEYAVRHNTQAKVNVLNESLDELSETQFGIETQLSKQIMDGLDVQLSADLSTRVSKHDDHAMEAYRKQNETVLNLTPSVKPTINRLHAEIGASINNDNQNDVKIFPHIQLELPLNNEQMSLFAGWTGRTMMNGYLEIQNVNPRISSNAFTQNFTKEIRTPLGMRGTLSNQFSFSASINQEVIKNAPLWLNDASLGETLAGRSFTTFYEEELTSWRPNVAANFQFGESVDIVTDVSYNFYNTEVAEEAWQLPDLNASLALNFRPIESLLIRGDVQGLSGIDYRYTDGEMGTLDGVFNANLGAQFDVNQQLSLFIDANNLANSNVEIWKNYPAVGTNILAGVVFSLN